MVAILFAGLCISLYAWKERRYLSVDQELALYSLGNRYIESFCNNPSALSELLEGTFIPQSLLLKSSDYLTDLKNTEGECFGNHKDELQRELLEGIRELPSYLISRGLATEFSVGDFFNCLVKVENSFYGYNDAAANIFSCVDENLDIRGFWYDLFVGHRARNHRYDYDNYPIAAPISVLPPPPPIPEPVVAYPQYCFEQCLDQCNYNTGEASAPMPVSMPDPGINN